MTARVCPHPSKRWFATKSHAKRAIRAQHGPRGGDPRASIQAYRCVCGGFHLGHKLGQRAKAPA